MPFGDLQRSTIWLTLYQTYHFTSTLPHNSVVFSTDDLILKTTLSGILIQKLGGGFNFFEKFHPSLGKMNPFWRAYFSDGVGSNHQLANVQENPWKFNSEFSLENLASQ